MSRNECLAKRGECMTGRRIDAFTGGLRLPARTYASRGLLALATLSMAWSTDVTPLRATFYSHSLAGLRISQYSLFTIVRLSARLQFSIPLDTLTLQFTFREGELIMAGKNKEYQFELTKDSPLTVLSQAARDKIERMGYDYGTFYDHFPCFTDAKTLARFISLAECYQKTLGIAGHIAEVGVFRGAVSMFFAKLTLLYEPNSITQVHAFDWFRRPTPEEIASTGGYGYGDYYEPYERIRDLVEVQGLQRYLLLHRLNVVTELEGFFRQNSHLQFKLVLLDAGEYYDLVARSIRELWPRLSNGGIMVFDQFNHEVAPAETLAVRELLPPEAVIRTFPNGWMPTAYVVKGEA